MVRTADRGATVSGGKAPRKEHSGTRRGASSGMSSTNGSGRRKSIGGNRPKTRPIPEWQQPIKNFYGKTKEESKQSSNEDEDKLDPISSDSCIGDESGSEVEKDDEVGTTQHKEPNAGNSSEDQSSDILMNKENKDSSNMESVSSDAAYGTAATKCEGERLNKVSNAKILRMNPEYFKHLEEMEH